MERRVVETASGRVRGGVGAGVAAFRGIPFAASPVGDLRLAPPVSHSGWTGLRDALVPGPAAPQGPSRLEAVMGPRTPDWDEDGCLNLNVWTPLGALDGARRPVLLWFHGGGFTSGSGGWPWYDGTTLAARDDIVVVTANYRLGPLGYLWLPEIGADNLGQRDQAAALRWVHSNIAAFGGDPAMVTVGGQSAGSYSALYLGIEPETRDLMRRVLALSVPMGLHPQEPDAAADTTRKYLDILGVTTDPAKALREIPVGRLLAAYGRLAMTTGRPGSFAPPMHPVLGGAGVPRRLGPAIADGDLADLDLLIGTTANEMTAFYALNEPIVTATREDVLKILARWVGDDADEVYRTHQDRDPDGTPARILTAAATELLFRVGTLEIAEARSAQGHPPYVYRFDRRPPQDDKHLGSSHCADLPFLFGTLDAFPGSLMHAGMGDGSRALAASYSGALATFVATGHPHPPWNPYPEIRHFDEP